MLLASCGDACHTARVFIVKEKEIAARMSHLDICSESRQHKALPRAAEGKTIETRARKFAETGEVGPCFGLCCDVKWFNRSLLCFLLFMAFIT